MIIEICKYSEKDHKKRKKYKRLHKEGKVKLVERNKNFFIYEDIRNEPNKPHYQKVQ